jgi:iron complex transport system ATP-binding protein
MIEANNVVHAYGDRRVLHGVSLAIDDGETVAVVGPNGAGKSTLLKTLLGFLEPESGEVRLDGVSLDGLDRREVARRAAFVPQGFHTDFAFTVREMVAMGRTPHRGRFSPLDDADRAAIAEALGATDTAEMVDRSFAELSGGERQRVLLARAFAQSAPVLLLDEPNANLDLLHACRLLEIVRRRVAAGGAALMALHDLGLAARYCDRVVVLAAGRVRADGPPAEVLTEPLLRSVFGVDARIFHEDDGLYLGVRGPSSTKSAPDP